MVKFWPKIKIPLALGIKKLGISTENGKGRGRGDQKMRKYTKGEKSNLLTVLTRRSTELGPVNRFVETEDLKRLLCFVFSPISSSSSRIMPIQLLMSDFWGHYSRLRALDWFLEARVLDLGRFLLIPCITINFITILAHLGFRLWVLLFLPTSSPLSLSFSWLLGESRQPLGHRASAQLSRLSLLRRRLTEKRGLTPPYSVLWRIIRGTNKSLLRGK